MIFALATSAALAGCGSGVTSVEGRATTDPDTFDCRGAKVSTTGVESAPLAASLPEAAQRAFARLAAVDDVPSYRVLDDRDGYLTIGKSLSPKEAARIGPGHRVNFRMASIQSSNSGGESAFGWWYVSDTACELQRTFSGLEAADTWLDPAFPAPQRGDTAVHLLVSERGCAGGERAGDRIKVAELFRNETQVRIAIGIKPQIGLVTCPGIPPEPFTVELGDPLGDEQIVDSAAYPARPFNIPAQTAPR